MTFISRILSFAHMGAEILQTYKLTFILIFFWENKFKLCMLTLICILTLSSVSVWG